MRHSFPSRAPRWIGLATLVAGLPTAAFGQAANPLGVEWIGGRAAATPALPPATENPLGVEWLGSSQDAAKPAPASEANNPLGVEWVGGSKSAPTSPPTASNPLGVDWVGGGTTAAKPTPSPTSDIRTNGSGVSRPSSPLPQPPAPTQPSVPAPQELLPRPQVPVPPSPDAASPQPEASQANLSAVLIDSWTYQAVAFTSSSGSISETRGVSGTLTFKADGQYEQALSIGGIANVMKGSYRIVGGRLETTYPWRGEFVTDIFDLYLDPAGKRLTLAGLGSPKSHYTLQRVE